MKRGRVDDEEFNPVSKKLKLTDQDVTGVNRLQLDFDGIFNRVCCITMKKNNLFCCLYCGKYFQGKNVGSVGFVHCSKTGHQYLVNIRTKKIFQMPSSVEITNYDQFNDILFNIDPQYSPDSLIDYYRTAPTRTYRDVFGNPFVPGYLPFTSGTSGIQVIMYLLSSIKNLRNEFLFHQYSLGEKKLFDGLSEMMKKLWNWRNFKKSYDLNGFMSTISNLSNGEYKMGKYCDPNEFLLWLLRSLDTELSPPTQTHNKKKKKKKKRRRKKSMIKKLFGGTVFVETNRIEFLDEEERTEERARGSDKKEVLKTFKKTHPFLTLQLQIPDEKFQTRNVDDGSRSINQPVNYDADGGQQQQQENRIIDFVDLLKKFDGERTTRVTLYNGDLENKKYRAKKLPEFLIFHFDRFLVNKFFMEKIKTLVRYPSNFQVDFSEALGYSDSNKGGVVYELKVNIIHTGNLKTQKFSLQGGINPSEFGKFYVQIYDQIRRKWIQIKDGEVQDVIGPEESIGISESYIALFQKKKRK